MFCLEHIEKVKNYDVYMAYLPENRLEIGITLLKIDLEGENCDVRTA